MRRLVAAPHMSIYMNSVIQLNKLRIVFGKRTILDDLEIDLQGSCIGLLGPNGAGKTTLIHTLLGFYKPTSGTAQIFGHDIHNARKKALALIGYMPERDAFIADMTCVNFVRMMGEVSGLPADIALERAHEALFYVGLGEARYRKLGTYSLGMKQMAKLAQALVHGPKLLFLDEPTNGLDPPARKRMIELIREIRDAGKTHIVFSSHLLRDVEECCDEVLILKDGRIAANCNLEEERRLNRKFVELETQVEAKVFANSVQSLADEYAITGKHRLKLIMQDGKEIRDIYKIAASNNIQIRRLNFKRDSLEDIFLKAMGN